MHSRRPTFLPAFAAALFILSGTAFASGDPKSEIQGGFDLRAYRLEETLRFAGRKLESPSVRYEDLMETRNSLPGTGHPPQGMSPRRARPGRPHRGRGRRGRPGHGRRRPPAEAAAGSPER